MRITSLIMFSKVKFIIACLMILSIHFIICDNNIYALDKIETNKGIFTVGKSSQGNISIQLNGDSVYEDDNWMFIEFDKVFKTSAGEIVLFHGNNGGTSTTDEYKYILFRNNGTQMLSSTLDGYDLTSAKQDKDIITLQFNQSFNGPKTVTISGKDVKTEKVNHVLSDKDWNDLYDLYNTYKEDKECIKLYDKPAYFTKTLTYLENLGFDVTKFDIIARNSCSNNKWIISSTELKNEMNKNQTLVAQNKNDDRAPGNSNANAKSAITSHDLSKLKDSIKGISWGSKLDQNMIDKYELKFSEKHDGLEYYISSRIDKTIKNIHFDYARLGFNANTKEFCEYILSTNGDDYARFMSSVLASIESDFSKPIATTSKLKLTNKLNGYTWDEDTPVSTWNDEKFNIRIVLTSGTERTNFEIRPAPWLYIINGKYEPTEQDKKKSGTSDW